jgi:hypothetical protein
MDVPQDDPKNRKHAPTAALISRALQIQDPELRARTIRDIRELRDRYAGTGAEYQAPNGKPSELLTTLGEERGREAWYAVRTGNFKEWFGDWEIEAIADWLKTAEAVKNLTGDEFVKRNRNLKTQVQEYYEKEFGRTVERKGFGKIILSNSGIKSRIAHRAGFNRQAVIAFAAVPEVLQHGKMYNPQKNWKGRGYDTYTIGGPINIGTEGYIVEVIIKKSGDDSSYYLHRVEVKEKLHDAFKTGSDTSASAGASILIIAEKLQAVKGKISQACDQNGEPQAQINAQGERVFINTITTQVKPAAGGRPYRSDL